MTEQGRPTPPSRRLGRRDALRLGGTTLSLAAIAAACGDGRTGDPDPGRVGLAPIPDPLPDYEVDDVVLLRTAASLENTVVSIHETAGELGLFDGGFAELATQATANHAARASDVNALVSANGGTPWTDVNPWFVERTFTPVLDAIVASDDPGRDAINLAITLENLVAGTYQDLVGRLIDPTARLTALRACIQANRQAAAMALSAFGVANRFSPALVGEEVDRTADGVLREYAIETRFGQVGQLELVAGPPDQNGVRTTFLMATPAANSYIYRELSDA